jgi:hypothetical protein
VGANSSNTFVIDISPKDLKDHCGMHFLAGACLQDVPYSIKV